MDGLSKIFAGKVSVVKIRDDNVANIEKSMADHSVNAVKKDNVASIMGGGGINILGKNEKIEKKNSMLARDEKFDMFKIKGENLFKSKGTVSLMGNGKGTNMLMGNLGPSIGFFKTVGSTNPMLSHVGSNPFKSTGQNPFRSGMSFHKHQQIGLMRTTGQNPFSSKIAISSVNKVQPFTMGTGIVAMEQKLKPSYQLSGVDRQSWWRINQQTGLPPFGDYDKDGVVNILDCQPRNRYKQESDPNAIPEEELGGGVIHQDLGVPTYEQDAPQPQSSFGETLEIKKNQQEKMGDLDVVDISSPTIDVYKKGDVEVYGQPTTLEVVKEKIGKGMYYGAVVPTVATGKVLKATAEGIKSGSSVVMNKIFDIIDKKAENKADSEAIMAAVYYNMPQAAKDALKKEDYARYQSLYAAYAKSEKNPKMLVRGLGKVKALTEIGTATTYASFSKKRQQAYKALMGDNPTVMSGVQRRFAGVTRTTGFGNVDTSGLYGVRGVGSSDVMLMSSQPTYEQTGLTRSMFSMPTMSGPRPTLMGYGQINTSGPVTLMPGMNTFGSQQQQMEPQQQMYQEPPQYEQPRQPTYAPQPKREREVVPYQQPNQQGMVWSPLSKRWVRYPRGPYRQYTPRQQYQQSQ